VNSRYREVSHSSGVTRDAEQTEREAMVHRVLECAHADGWTAAEAAEMLDILGLIPTARHMAAARHPSSAGGVLGKPWPACLDQQPEGL
jgi:hypothetical protein